MARIKALENDGGQSAMITVDGAVVGGISMTGRGVYTVDTKGHVPAIDGLEGPSPREAWDAVVAEVQAGRALYFVKPVQIGPYEVDDK